MPKIAMLSTKTMSFPIRKIGMLKMPKIAMLSTKTMSFPIRKIGMLEMPKIAMLSTLRGHFILSGTDVLIRKIGIYDQKCTHFFHTTLLTILV